MATFRTTVATPWPASRAFDFMADASNFVRWDPGVISSRQVEGVAPGDGAEFDVEVKSIGRPIVLRYRTTRYEAPGGNSRGVVQLEAVSSALTSIDRIEVAASDNGSTVTFSDADLQLNGVWRILAPAMALGFHRIGERAANGLTQALDGERVSA